MIKKLLLLLILASSSWAQLIRWSGTTGDVSLTGSGTTATIQQPATGSVHSVGLEQAVVYCSVACNITQSQNGTAASATAGTLTAITNTSGTITTLLWTASNVGAGTAVGGIYHLAAGQSVILDLTKVSLPATLSGAVNYSITISSITGTANITFYGHEQ